MPKPSHTNLTKLNNSSLTIKHHFLIHGYAEKGESFYVWKSKLEARGYKVKVLGYTSLSNEVTLKDIAEGFERALHLPGGLKSDEHNKRRVREGYEKISM